jgi:hypothetical protein
MWTDSGPCGAQRWLLDGTRKCAPYPRLVARAPSSVHTACRMWSQTWDGRFCARRLSWLQEGLVGSRRLVVSDRALHCVGAVLKIRLIDWNLYGACRRCVAWPHNHRKSSDHKMRNTQHVTELDGQAKTRGVPVGVE